MANDDTGTFDPESIQDAGVRQYIDKVKADLQTERENRLALERRTVFAEAGLSEHPAKELLEKAYEEGMTADALKEAAAKYGLLGDGAAKPPADDNRADLDAIRRTQQASQGAPGATPMEFGDALDRVQTREQWDYVMRNAPADARIRLSRTAGGYRIV